MAITKPLVTAIYTEGSVGDKVLGEYYKLPPRGEDFNDTYPPDDRIHELLNALDIHKVDYQRFEQGIGSTTSTSYSIAVNDNIIVFTGSANSTFTLPAISGINNGRQYTIINDTAYVLTLDGNGSETIDGDLTQNVDDVLVVITDGTEWFIIGRKRTEEYAYKNVIINGAMVHDQRDSDTTAVQIDSTDTKMYGPDRFFGEYIGTGGGGFTIERELDAPNGFMYSTLITVTTLDSAIAATDAYIFGQIIEASNISRFGFDETWAKIATLSFWVKSPLTGTYCISLMNDDEDRSYVSEFTIDSADTWEFKTVTFTADTGSAWNNVGNGVGLQVAIALAAGSNFHGTNETWEAARDYSTSSQVNFMSSATSRTMNVTGVQLELGSRATQFEYVDYATELHRCKRYFETINPDGEAAYIYCMGQAISTTVVIGHLRYTPKRAAIPTLTYAGSFFLWNAAAASTATTGNPSPFDVSRILTGLTFTATSAAMVAGNASGVTDSGGTSRIFVAAEL